MTCVPYRRRQSTAPKSGAPKSVRSAAAGQSLDIDGIHLHLTRKPIKNLYLRIKPPSGRVEISAPMRMSESRIADFVKERHSWILAQQQRMAEAQRRSIMALNEGAGFENGGRGVAGASGHDGRRCPVVRKPVISVVRELVTPARPSRYECPTVF